MVRIKVRAITDLQKESALKLRHPVNASGAVAELVSVPARSADTALRQTASCTRERLLAALQQEPPPPARPATSGERQDPSVTICARDHLVSSRVHNPYSPIGIPRQP